ncbi:MAG: adenosylcobinamide-phosphate synthase CbiB [Muribaculaceae bacterium]|nr:adenosylcobinamide-phosphate synthase CbiB [Muribaculaceae bacterium]
MDYVMTLLPLLIGWILDRLFGDPEHLPHPIVWFGKAISLFEHRYNKGKYLKLKGGVVAIILIVAVFVLTALTLRVISPIRWLELLVQSLMVFYCLAGTTLSREVRMTFEAVDRSLECGRKQVGRIVGRDTSDLSAQEIRTAALETLAENLSDGVIAPLFWYVLLGVPGMLTYKMVNTLDSMIGYRTIRYREFGCVAARIDDIANYIPARITALLMILVSGRMDRLRFVCEYGPRHASPNSGYPEAALAGILDCRFGGPHDYFGERVAKPFIGRNHRDFSMDDAVRAIGINRSVEVVGIILTIAVRWSVLSLTHMAVWL